MYSLTCHLPNCRTSVGYASSTAASRCRQRLKYISPEQHPSRPGWPQPLGDFAQTTAASRERQCSKYTAPQPTRYIRPSERPRWPGEQRPSSQQEPYPWFYDPIDRYDDRKTPPSAAEIYPSWDLESPPVQTLSSTATALEPAASLTGAPLQQNSTVQPGFPAYPDAQSTISTTEEEIPAPPRAIKPRCKLSAAICEAASDSGTVGAWLSQVAAEEPAIAEDLDFEVLDRANLENDAGDFCGLDPAESAFDDRDFEHLEDLEDESAEFEKLDFVTSDFEDAGSDFEDSDFGASWAKGSECDEVSPLKLPLSNTGVAASLPNTPTRWPTGKGHV